MAIFTDNDKEKLLAQPAITYYRSYGSTGPWNKFVLANGAKYQPAVEQLEIQFDDAGIVSKNISKETATINISSGRIFDLDAINTLSGNLYTKSSVPGTLVEDAEQVVAAGKWEYDGIIMLTNKNGDGSLPTINSITASTNGPLVLGTDVFTVLLPEVGWGIYIVDSTTVTTENQSITIDSDYTPDAQTIYTRGGKTEIVPFELAFQTTDANGDYVTTYFYKVYSDGNDGHGYGSEVSAEPILIDLTFTAEADKNRTSGDELMKIVYDDSYLG